MEQWKCPCCWSNNLDYGSVEFYDDQCWFPRDCLDCKANWMEWYSMEFIEHDVYEEWNLATNQKEEWYTLTD